MNDFDWADLTHKRAQSRHVMIICELSNEYFERIHVEKGHAIFVAVFAHCKAVLGAVSLLTSLVRALCHHVANGAAHALFLFHALTALFLLPFGELAWCFSLLDDCNFEA